ncbi:PREDICTED: xaa-Pro aminopeptidase 1 [Diuraphis noxia]|uniref:xaa-Pro aminopeptidase 1 n=1 Tax=Diuraphis noxia TaxID=143948 RepID=UPI0007635F49|nr:PREDICTED: xaa-Pro aminopeptidase 1 [Diuraphis noxia]XP_015369363.1 PREDICTED: xaa-Pro aminopeptidase 1 [Diuraphis noxia]
MAVRSTGPLLSRLRDLMKLKYLGEPIQGYIVLSEDAHQNEYISACDGRRAFITGFTGSAGVALITQNEALLWTDGRYFVQAQQQLDDNWTLMKMGLPDTSTLAEWLTKNMKAGSRIAVDANLITYSEWRRINKEIKYKGINLVPLDTNLIDRMWSDRPAIPSNPVKPLNIKFTGKKCGEKVEEVRQKMTEKNATILLVTALDEIAWLLNLRGSDITYNPVFYSYVIVTHTDVHLFVDDKKLDSTVPEHFKSENLSVIIQPYDKLHTFFNDILASDNSKTGKVWVSDRSSYNLVNIVPKSNRISKPTPIPLMKAIKNSVEINGLKNAHIKDGAALCSYFAWLEENISLGNLTEISVAEKLLSFRNLQEDFVGPSFETISSSGPNCGIIHYAPTPETDRKLSVDEMYLCDSGGQFLDGTTDVTRTFHFGTPTEYQKECFTRVFKGQANLAMSKFPHKILGNCLDSYARRFLWDVGLDYMHGTGHGIGAYLNVHEGPMGISWREIPNDPGLQPGMFLSNEPGYYEETFGIRIEDIVLVKDATTDYKMPQKPFLQFETVTMCPIQSKMLLLDLLTDTEINYLNEYHRKCLEILTPLLEKLDDKRALTWLKKETQPIKR